jgi:hypothetical protein
MLKKFNEYFVQAQFEPLTSFRLKDELNPKVWDDFKINEDVRKELLTIGRDFFDKVEIPITFVDIVLTGSLCNYNWSEKYSDFDLHIIINYEDIDENYELVEKFCDYAKKLWNSEHDIQISGFDVEVAIQDAKDLQKSIDGGKMGGVFSLVKNEWIKKPKKEKFIPDEDLIRKKAENIMTQINELEDELEKKVPYEKISEKLKKVWKKIKEGREVGLEREGEFSIENLVFKFLRRNEYITRLLDVKRKSYDKQFK